MGLTNQIKGVVIALLLPFLGLFLALVVVEAIVRVSGITADTKGLGWDDRPKFYAQASGTSTMQNYPYSAEKGADVFRIAVVGDSFTFAPYMQFFDAFPAKLQNLLNMDATSEKRAEVINYGVPAYSTSHEIALVKKAIQEQADLIILQITLNDPELKLHRPSGITENMNDKFGKFEPKGALVTLCKYWRTLAFVLARLHNSSTHSEYIRYFNDLFENPRTWNPFTDSMKQLVNEARNANTNIVAVVFPLFGLPMDDKYPFYPIHDKVDSLLSSYEVPHFDLSKIYKGIPLERLQVIPGGDRHPNEIAHRMAAEEIYSWLEKEKLIPPELVIKDKFEIRLGIANQRRVGDSLP